MQYGRTNGKTDISNPQSIIEHKLSALTLKFYWLIHNIFQIMRLVFVNV